MKRLARLAIHKAVASAPWGVREAMLEACLSRIGPVEVSARLFPKLGISEVGVWGKLGLIRSAWNDREVIASYARAGGLEFDIITQVESFYGDEIGTYVDVGANIGLTTIPIARNPKIRCIAFEPEPGNFRFLKLNIAENVIDNEVELHQCAVFDKNSELSLAIADGNLGDHRLTKTAVPGRQSVTVSAVPLDSILDRVVGKLALKIDTQGAEPSVITGGRKVLNRAGLLAIEFCPYLMRQLGGDPEVVIDAIGSFERVALIEAGSGAQPVFNTPSIAQAALRSKVKTATNDGGDYVDVIARRSQ